jgi:hypothetical protein
MRAVRSRQTKGRAGLRDGAISMLEKEHFVTQN